jgi:hypothetical protein
MNYKISSYSSHGRQHILFDKYIFYAGGIIYSINTVHLHLIIFERENAVCFLKEN